MTENWARIAREGTDYNFAFTLSTIVDGRAISIKGSDVTDDLRWYNDALPWEDPQEVEG